MSKRIVSANGVNLHYLQSGYGDDLVMIHGLTGNLAIWFLEIVPTLRNSFRITTYDLRGHGRSEMPRSGYTTENLAKDLLGVLDALDIECPHLLGHSLGADIALHFALLYPDRAKKLILVEPAIPALAWQRKGADWEGWAYWAEMLKHYSDIDIPPDKRNDIRYMVQQSVNVPIIYGPAKGLPRKKDRTLELVNETTVIEDYEIAGDMTLENLAQIPHDKLLIYDGDSPYMGTFEVLRDRLINCIFEILPPGKHRHFGPLADPQTLLQYTTAFLGDSNEMRPLAASGKKEASRPDGP